MDTKMSRKGFLALVFGGVVALVMSQIPGGTVFAKKRAEKGYGSSAYGG